MSLYQQAMITLSAAQIPSTFCFQHPSPISQKYAIITH